MAGVRRLRVLRSGGDPQLLMHVPLQRCHVVSQRLALVLQFCVRLWIPIGLAVPQSVSLSSKTSCATLPANMIEAGEHGTETSLER
jgi:type IV secretory pathway TrbD component